MAESAATATIPSKAEVVAKQAEQDTRLKTLEDALADRTKEIGELKTKVANQPQYGVAGIVGGIPSDNIGYSVLKMAAYTKGWVDREQVKYEMDVSDKLAKIYQAVGWTPTTKTHGDHRTFVPFGTAMLPLVNDEASRVVAELKCKMIAGADQVDQDEVQWIQKKMGMRTKDLGTISDAAGGVLVGFPTLGELVDLQRNMEVFANAGATEQALPPNGRLQLPKLTGPTTAFWVGEAATINESTPATGYLDLQAKKLGILVDLNNELIRFASISSEAMVRTDMAKVAALKMDLAQLEGTGGTQIKGLITYSSASTWTTGTDPLLAYTVTSNLLQVKDAAEMEAIMPDTAGEPTAWVMRRQLFAKLQNRRADAASSADSSGPFLVNIIRDLSERIPLQWNGTKVVRSTQVSATRGSGTQTYAILGYFPDWTTARFGVLEFLSSMVGDTQMTNDQTRIRCIQHVDAGARHASSFVFADAITIS